MYGCLKLFNYREYISVPAVFGAKNEGNYSCALAVLWAEQRAGEIPAFYE